MRPDRNGWLPTLLLMGLASSAALAEDPAKTPGNSSPNAGISNTAKSNLMTPDRVFELRIYTVHPGKMPDMLKRFREHTTKLFEKHGMENVGYWVSDAKPGEEPKLYYIVAHKSRDAAKASWDAFRKDPDWISARDESERAGKIVAKVESIFLSPTDFSGLK